MITQKHSINKVILTVDTNNNKTAYQFKDNLSVFLKQEIFPYLANYFDKLVDNVPAEIIQIEQLNLEINVTNSNNFSELKNDLKNQIKTKVESKISNLIKNKKKVTLITTKESQLKAFFHFLEEGVMPWWNEHKTKESVTKKELLKLVKVPDFKNLFEQKIKNKVVQHRLTNQFYNNDLLLLCTKIFQTNRIEKALIKVIASSKFKNLNSNHIKTIWLIMFDYYNTKNQKKTHLDLVKLNHKISVNKRITTSKLSDLKTIITKLIRIVSEEPISKSTSENIELNSPIFERNKSISTDLSNEIKEKLALDNKVKKDAIIAKNTLEFRKEKQVNPNEIKAFQSKATKNNLKTKVIEAQEISENESSTKNKRISTNKKEKLVAKKNHNLENKDNQELKNVNIKNTKATNKEKDIKNEGGINIKEELVNLKKTTKLQKTALDFLGNETNKKPLKEDIENVKNINTQESEKTTYINKLDPNTKLPEVLANSLLKNNQNLENEFLENPKATYYIKNAGLILIHPFLKQFFQNCELLTDDNQLKNKELAVHLLHYIATKKENQLESNLVFEKFLCGIPIKKPIDRKIKISKKLKEQTEELLKAILENWEVLKNSSTDLLRFEFLQRDGKLTLEKDNPKIIIERKTQDILLDKIAWNISICKIPWLQKLIFTDW